MMEINPVFALCIVSWAVLPVISLVLSLIAIFIARRR
jgi:hypothetical protein